MVHIDLIETVEYIADMFGRNHGTGICHRETYPPFILFTKGRQTDGNFPVFRCKLKGIGQEIEINTFQLLHVCQCMIIRIRHTIKRKMDMLLTGCRLKRLIPSFERRKDIHRNRSIFHLAIFIFTEIQNLIDQTQKNVHIPLNQHEHPVLISAQCLVRQQMFYRIGNQCQRSTEVVRNIGEKYQLGMSSFFQLMRKLYQLVTLFFQFVTLLFQLLLLLKKFFIQAIL